jgi:hypothetical protein
MGFNMALSGNCWIVLFIANGNNEIEIIIKGNKDEKCLTQIKMTL